MKYFLYLTILLIISCTPETKEQITSQEDYDSYLNLGENEAVLKAEKNIAFWESRIKEDSSQIIALAKSAGAYSTLFEANGNIANLIHAETNYKKAMEKAAIGKSGYLRGLARNYISQHRFKEALALLNEAELIGENLSSTEKMLFDVHLELGNHDLAKHYLEKISNISDFDYLIRVSKWSDHKGDLDSAIKYMEKAMEIAESSNLPDLKQWTYTNIADFYGHAGRIKDSYEHYLKALEINPYNAYAKKGIAWIVYSHEDNPDEAMRILKIISEDHHSPDYHLLMSEIAEYQENEELMQTELALYNQSIADKMYGDMYNKYKVLLMADDKTSAEKALEIAKVEVDNRPTPQSYDLLAWAYFKNGDVEKALDITEKNVVDKTFEPEVLYHVAEIYKAAGKEKEVAPLKQELLASIYELGPTMKDKIYKL